VGEQEGFLAHARRGQGGFGASVAATNDYDIKFRRK
jgi:hypothetical protein